MSKTFACGRCGSAASRATFVVTFPSGETRTYGTEIEARAAIARKGGTYKKK